jgi:cell division protein FtsN
MSDQVQSSPEAPSQSSQFVGGLVMGLVLGTAGYYFFGTPAGKKQRQVLLTKWDKLKPKWPKTQNQGHAGVSDRQSGIRLGN